MLWLAGEDTIRSSKVCWLDLQGHRRQANSPTISPTLILLLVSASSSFPPYLVTHGMTMEDGDEVIALCRAGKESLSGLRLWNVEGRTTTTAT